MFGSVDGNFAMKMLVFATVISIAFPMLLTMFAIATPDSDSESDPVTEQLTEDYYAFTGTRASATTDNVWVLSGIFTPYNGSSYGYEKGWLYGSRIANYTPTQYAGNAGETYAVTYDYDKGYYTYTATPQNDTSKTIGDLYTMVSMDVNQKSSVFFTSANKVESDDGYLYEYTGYRYQFSPVVEYEGVDSGGNTMNVTRNDALSLIWYQWKSNVSGIAGQLMLTTDRGVAYITATEIINAYNSNNMTATFKMDFNGVTMNVLIRLNPTYIGYGESITDAYNNGHWSLMVSAPAKAIDLTTSTNAFNIPEMWDVIVSLFTFDMEKYGLDTLTATLCSLLFVTPLYLALIVLALQNSLLWVAVAFLSLFQAGGLLGFLS